MLRVRIPSRLTQLCRDVIQGPELEAANLAQTASSLGQDQTALQPALDAFGSISQNTLRNYLKLG